LSKQEIKVKTVKKRYKKTQGEKFLFAKVELTKESVSISRIKLTQHYRAQ